MESHLLQMRGLKHGRSNGINKPKKSHLLQMRGLKQKRCATCTRTQESHLLQMRGLKLELQKAAELKEGRIFYRCVD